MSKKKERKKRKRKERRREKDRIETEMANRSDEFIEYDDVTCSNCGGYKEDPTTELCFSCFGNQQ